MDRIREANSLFVLDSAQKSYALILPYIYQLRFGDRLETVAKMYDTKYENIKTLDGDDRLFSGNWVLVFPQELVNCQSSNATQSPSPPSHLGKLAKAKLNKIESYLEWLISYNEEEILSRKAYFYEIREKLDEKEYAIVENYLKESIRREETFTSEIRKLKECFFRFCKKIEDLKLMVGTGSKQAHPLLALDSFNSLVDWFGECLDNTIFPVKWESTYQRMKGHYPTMPMTERKERCSIPAELFLESSAIDILNPND